MSDDSTQVTEGQESSPAGFSPITTQEEFDQAIKGRIARAEQSAEKRFMDTHADVFAKAKQFDAMEEANKSELQKAQDALQKANEELEGYRRRDEIRAWQKEVSDETGVPADLLRGNTKEEMEAHAEQLKGFVNPTVPAAPYVSGVGRPVNQATSDDPIRDIMFSRK